MPSSLRRFFTISSAALGLAACSPPASTTPEAPTAPADNTVTIVITHERAPDDVQTQPYVQITTPAEGPAPSPFRTEDVPLLSLDITYSAADSNINSPAACVLNNNLDDLKNRLPQIYRDMAVLQRLPITGRPVFAYVADPRYAHSTCLRPAREMPGISGYNQGRISTLSRPSSPIATIHEYYHAYHDAMGFDRGLVHLSPEDAAFAITLHEAAAVAYTLAVQYEAKKLGIDMMPAGSHRRGSGIAESPAINSAFNRAYDAAFAAATDEAPVQRERLALQAGGQAVTRYMLAGHHRTWLNFYGKRAQEITEHHRAYEDTRLRPSNYRQHRDALFSAAGRLDADLSFIPDAYTGDDADRHIAQTMAVLGMSPTTARQPARSRAPGT